MKKILLLIFIPLSLQANTKEDWITYYTRDCKNVGYFQACRQKLEKSIGLMESYKSMTFYHLKRNNLPTFLAILPIIESNYNRYAMSKIDGMPFALGLYQISWLNYQRYYELGKLTKLKKKHILKLDDWKDPEISTEVACWILKGLYKKYKDWRLVLYAYNAGGKTVDDWIKGKRELPEQSRNFYLQFLALSEIIGNMDEYDIDPHEYAVKYKRYAFINQIKALL